VSPITRQDIIDGAAVLSITDQRSEQEQAYWCQVLFADGRCLGYRLAKLGTDTRYTLSRDLAACDCPDRAFTARPGGCRHMVALRQALMTVPRQ
jgi:hypothetical protein